MILDIIPYSTDKNLGKAYNDAFRNTSDDVTHICFRDGDTCWLTPDYGVHLAEYVRLHHNAVLTCWTNRINEKAEQQFSNNNLRNESDIKIHLEAAKLFYIDLYKTTPLRGFVSGFCMVIPRSVWNNHKFAEQQVYSDRGPTNMLGVDNDFTNRVRAAGVPVLRMDGLYIWHTYRLLQGDNDKTHLL
jgi:GT2 family glycosyltransferase